MTIRHLTLASLALALTTVVGCSSDSSNDTAVESAVPTESPVGDTTGGGTPELETNDTCGLTLAAPSLRGYCGSVGTRQGDGMSFDHPDGLATRYAIDVENSAGQPLVFGALYIGATDGVVTTDSGVPLGDIDLYFLAQDSAVGFVIMDIVEVVGAEDFSIEGSHIEFNGPESSYPSVELVGTNFVFG